MARTFLLLLLMFPFVLVGKETKKVTREYLDPPCKEIYYVLKSDTLIRHGMYSLIADKKIRIQGYYKMNKKDSLWTQFDRMGKLQFKGYYIENSRSGIWIYYNENEEEEQKIDFTVGEVMLFRTQLKDHPFKVIVGSDTIVAVLDRPPLFLVGQSRLNEIIHNEISAPFHKPKDKIKGSVFVEFTIDSTGTTSNYHVLKGLSAGCNFEAMRIVTSLPNNWLPGIYNGKRVSVNYIIPIQFKDSIPKKNSSFILME